MDKIISNRARLRLVACVMVHKAASRSKLLDDATFAKWKCKPFRLAHCTRKERSLSTNGRIFDERDIRQMEVQALPLGSLFAQMALVENNFIKASASAWLTYQK